jgi:hypothetical protein
MNNNLQIIITFIVVLLFVIAILVFITRNNIKSLENFAMVDIPEQNFPPLVNNAIIAIPGDKPPANETDSYIENIFETFETIAPNNIKNPSLDGYGVLYITSSFTNVSTTNLLAQTLNNNNTSIVTLASTKLNSIINALGLIGNYIKISYPEKFKFKKIIIKRTHPFGEFYANSNPTQETVKLIIYAGLGELTEVKTTISREDDVDNIVKMIFTSEILIETSNILIYFTNHFKTINIKNIEIYGYPINKAATMFMPDENENTEINRMLSDNPYSQFETISTESYESQEEVISYTETTQIERFIKLLKMKTPYAIYNTTIAKVGNNTAVSDLLGRKCRDAIITGAYTIETDSNKVKYISGKTATSIAFPPGSLPIHYTICGITKYTSSGNRQRILTTNSGGVNWLLGHHQGINSCMHYNGWKTATNNPDIHTDTNWRVSCCKSSATNYKNSIIINNIPIANANAGAINNDNAAIQINNNPWGQNSDFGFAYLFIWKSVLSDTEMQIVSDILNQYIVDGIEFNLNEITALPVNDGLVKERAGISAEAIKNQTCTNDNGVYWIIDSKGVPRKVYCIMDSSCYGGGWMLAIKGASNSGIFCYDGMPHASNGYNHQLGRNNIINYWTTYNTLNEEDASMFDTDAKFEIFNTYPVKECMAIFDKQFVRNKLTFPDKPEYGWTWRCSNFYNRSTSLLNFFKNDIQYYHYTSVNPNYYAPVSSKIWAMKLPWNTFSKNFTDETCSFVPQYPRQIWSYQEAYKAIGFNIKAPRWNHSVRWGGTFNENSPGFPDSNDVSGGIGLQNRQWNAGDAIGCCQSSAGTNSIMSFKWFIK